MRAVVQVDSYPLRPLDMTVERFLTFLRFEQRGNLDQLGSIRNTVQNPDFTLKLYLVLKAYHQLIKHLQQYIRLPSDNHQA